MAKLTIDKIDPNTFIDKKYDDIIIELSIKINELVDVHNKIVDLLSEFKSKNS